MDKHQPTETGAAGPEIFVPTQAWIAEYTRQATDELYESAIRFATVRAEWVATTGYPVDDDYIEDVVADAYASTWCGTLHWDPARCTLEPHVINAIKSRTRHDYDKGGRLRRISIDAHTPSGALAAAEAALAGHTKSLGDDTDLADEGLEALRRIARDDLDVLRMLDAFLAGAFTPAEVTAHAKLPAKRYRNARLRLDRYRKQLSAELMERVRSRVRGRKS
jgi:hypothetical protein